MLQSDRFTKEKEFAGGDVFHFSLMVSITFHFSLMVGCFAHWVS